MTERERLLEETLERVRAAWARCSKVHRKLPDGPHVLRPDLEPDPETGEVVMGPSYIGGDDPNCPHCELSRLLSRPAPGGTVGLDGDTRRECSTCKQPVPWPHEGGPAALASPDPRAEAAVRNAMAQFRRRAADALRADHPNAAAIVEKLPLWFDPEAPSDA